LFPAAPSQGARLFFERLGTKTSRLALGGLVDTKLLTLIHRFVLKIIGPKMVTTFKLLVILVAV